MKADDARRLKDLERENARLKRIVADKELEIDRKKIQRAGAGGGPAPALVIQTWRPLRPMITEQAADTVVLVRIVARYRGRPSRTA